MLQSGQIINPKLCPNVASINPTQHQIESNRSCARNEFHSTQLSQCVLPSSGAPTSLARLLNLLLQHHKLLWRYLLVIPQSNPATVDARPGIAIPPFVSPKPPRPRHSTEKSRDWRSPCVTCYTPYTFVVLTCFPSSWSSSLQCYKALQVPGRRSTYGKAISFP